MSEEELIERFISENVDYIGPDAELIADHHIQPRTVREDAAIIAMAVSPAASGGDLTVTVFSAAGDLSMACLRGVIGFSAAGGYPIRYGRVRNPV